MSEPRIYSFEDNSAPWYCLSTVIQILIRYSSWPVDINKSSQIFSLTWINYHYFLFALVTAYNSELQWKMVCMYVVNVLSLTSSLMCLLLKFFFRSLICIRTSSLRCSIFSSVLRRELGYLNFFRDSSPALHMWYFSVLFSLISLILVN